jgi:vacuolar protein sorting-associated protein 53
MEENPESAVFTGELPAPIQALSNVSLLVTALGENFLKDVLERFSQLQLIPYERKFMPGKEFSGLEHLEQRWKWFRALMDCFDKNLSEVCPSIWRTKYYLYLEFVRRTKIHLKEQLKLLEDKALKLDEHVAELLKAMKSVMTFSGEMKTKLDIPEVAREYEAQILSESMSDAFDDFLEPYVKVERNALDELIQSTLLREEQSPAVADAKDGSRLELAIYESSGKIFEYIKRSVQRCSKFSTGHTLIELSMEFRVCLQQYANSLSRRMPLPCDESRYIKERVIDFEVKEGMPYTYHVTPESAVVVCRVMRTGEYCADTIPQLETLMKQLVRCSCTIFTIFR